jgi:hypothetical protein
MAIWYILWPFGICYGHLVYFMAIWYTYFMAIWYKVLCTTKNLVTQLLTIGLELMHPERWRHLKGSICILVDGPTEDPQESD